MASRDYLVFHLQEELYGVEVETINGVVELMPVTPVPKTPPYIAGAMNLRGNIITVVDFRILFDLPHARQGKETAIIIFEVPRHDSTALIGGIVDSVFKVIPLSENELEAPPRIGKNSAAGKYITGLGKREDSFILILDITKVLSVDELIGRAG